jgi:hypothetical protein
MKNLNIDIFIITETFLKDTIPNSFITIDGYDIIRRDRKVCKCKQTACQSNHKGGGILVYTRSSLNCTEHETHTSLESIWLKGTPPKTNETFYINASYHPPKNSNHDSPLTHYLVSSTTQILKDNPHSTIFIGGDFNKLNMSSLEDEGLKILHTPPTRKDATLDLLLTNRVDLVDKATTFTPSLKTDHLGIIMQPKQKMPPTRIKAYYRNYTLKNKEKLLESLQNFDFSQILLISDTNIAAQTLDNTLSQFVTTAFPMKSITMSDRDPSWITPKIKAKILKMKKLKQRNTARITKLYEQIGKQKLDRLGSKEWWNNIDNISHRKHTKKTILASSIDGASLNHALADRSRITNPTERSTPPIFNATPSNAPQIDLFDVMTALRKCKSTSPGPTDIPAFVFKEFWYILAPVYHHVWNLSLSTAVFPACYKQAKLTALPKTNKACTPNDIRGISVTPISARLFERIIHKTWILPNISTLGDPLQFAYKPSQSTADCLITLQHEILTSLDKSEHDGVHCITVDFSKAFDKLDQHIAAAKYSKFIKSENIQKWLHDFSINRTQGLYFNNIQYPQLSIHTGCSQGTVGGPNIFTMFTDDLRAINNNCSIIKYSDDSTLITPCKKHPTNKDKQILHEEITHIHNWSTLHKLHINSDKTKHIRFSLNNRQTCSCHIISDFETVKSVNILGITFQQDCSFRLHRKKLIASLRSLLYIIRDLKLKQKTEKEIDTVFNALIISKIRYGISTYGSDTKTIDKISTFLQRCHDKGFSPHKYDANQIMEQEDKRLIHNILKNTKHPLHNYLIKQRKDRHTRQGFTTTKPYTNTIAFHKTFCNRILPI